MLSSSLWYLVALFLVTLVVVTLLRMRSKGNDPALYYQRADRYIDRCDDIMSRAISGFSGGVVTTRQLESYLGSLQTQISMQSVNVPPDAIGEEHKKHFLRLMELNSEILEDLLYNDGRNFEALSLAIDVESEMKLQELTQRFNPSNQED